MLKQLGIRKGLDYYACSDHWEDHAVKDGKRKRWSDTAELNDNTDVIIDKDNVQNIKCDHAYNRSQWFQVGDCKMSKKSEFLILYSTKCK